VGHQDVHPEADQLGRKRRGLLRVLGIAPFYKQIMALDVAEFP
jgi:hypothetical protein